MFFDSHAHLDMLTTDPGELKQLVAKEFADKISSLVQVSTDPSIHSSIYSNLRRETWDIYFACGLTHAFSDNFRESLDKVTNIVSAGQVSAIGEIGLDYSRSPSPEDKARQKLFFVKQLAIAREADLPVILHTRDAAADTLELIDRFPDLAGVAHCFTGDADFAQALVERGWMISFSGILTFPSAGYLRDLAACVPEDRLLIETDAPFLSPVPFRGQTNFPSRVMHTAAVLADIRGVSLERIAALTAENGQRFFSHNRSAQRV